MELIVRDLSSGDQRSYQTIRDIDQARAAIQLDLEKPITFITGNSNKVNELKAGISSDHVKIIHQAMDVPEIQDSDILTIAQEKCCRAFERINKSNTDLSSVLVEDVSLHFDALNGMPGPYIKWFVEALKPEGLHRMLEGFEDKGAEAVCIYALMDNPSRVIFCKGSVRGRIIGPRGNSWGWDPIFEDESLGLTYGEMTPEVKAKHSHRARAIKVLQRVLSDHV